MNSLNVNKCRIFHETTLGSFASFTIEMIQYLLFSKPFLLPLHNFSSCSRIWCKTWMNSNADVWDERWEVKVVLEKSMYNIIGLRFFKNNSSMSSSVFLSYYWVPRKRAFLKICRSKLDGSSYTLRFLPSSLFYLYSEIRLSHILFQHLLPRLT